MCFIVHFDSSESSEATLSEQERSGLVFDDRGFDVAQHDVSVTGRFAPCASHTKTHINRPMTQQL